MTNGFDFQGDSTNLGWSSTGRGPVEWPENGREVKDQQHQWRGKIYLASIEVVHSHGNCQALVSGAWDGLNHSSPEPCGTAVFFSPVREVGDCQVGSGPTRCLFSLTFKQLQPSQHLHDCFVIITVVVVIIIIIIIIISDFLKANQAPVIKLEPRCNDGGRLSILRELPRPVGKARFRHQGQAARDDRWNKEETQEPPPNPGTHITGQTCMTARHPTRVMKVSLLREWQRQTLALAVPPKLLGGGVTAKALECMGSSAVALLQLPVIL
ncbi:uncharacterized protein LOC111545693 [Piliocolobus tephrosceles]|uniref:uncharacterized protein LOC111545693 n=1 Tax=Piliocolobus tephrosceles TaxID=591936 RepID=UPI000C2B4BC2|nr:uncharacterized protein LOC111545693 [Piliocolobus tephrosceles]